MFMSRFMRHEKSITRATERTSPESHTLTVGETRSCVRMRPRARRRSSVWAPHRRGTSRAVDDVMNPKPSYDDLVRGAVPLPDSSHRPSTAEAVAAETRPPGPRINAAFPDDGGANPDDVRGAIEALAGADLADLDVAIDSGRVTIDGSVATQEDRDRIVRAIGAVHGVITVIDTLRVRT
jgi:hypothetical protein